jgi:hypothetical protein
MLPFNISIGNWRFWTDNLIELPERQYLNQDLTLGACLEGTPKMASEQTKKATVAIAKELTIPTGGDDATPLSAPSPGAAPAPSKAGCSGTLSNLLEKGEGLKQEPPKLPLFSLSKEKRTSMDNAAAPEPTAGSYGASCRGLHRPKRRRGTSRGQTDPQSSLRHPHLCKGG